MYYTYTNDNWVEGKPTQTGQKFRLINESGVILESFWSEPLTPYPDNKITRLAFLNRFTDAEAIAIDIASIDNPSGTIQERESQAAIRRFLNKVNSANFIDLSLQQTIDGVNALVLLGLLTPVRASSILNNQIQEDERA